MMLKAVTMHLTSDNLQIVTTEHLIIWDIFAESEK